jgi:hypothetical protein
MPKLRPFRRSSSMTVCAMLRSECSVSTTGNSLSARPIRIAIDRTIDPSCVRIRFPRYHKMRDRAFLLVANDRLRHRAVNAVDNFLDRVNVAVDGLGNQPVHKLAQFGRAAIDRRLVQRGNELLSNDTSPPVIGLFGLLIAWLEAHDR